MTVKETIIYLNFDQPYPNQQFTAVIFKQDFSKLDSVITELRVLKDICVTGKIEMYKEKAQVIIKSADQVNPK